VDHLQAVDKGESADDVAQVAQRVVLRMPAEEARELAVCHPLADEVDRIVGFRSSHSVEGYDVWMAEKEPNHGFLAKGL
jgi:hypothetical protein